MQIQEIIVRQVAEYRHSQGITLREQAEEMGCDHAYLSRVESRRNDPSISFLEKALRYLVTKTQKKDVGNSQLQRIL
jgi:transcriptional regulator with XRE-family HTH domain